MESRELQDKEIRIKEQNDTEENLWSRIDAEPRMFCGFWAAQRGKELPDDSFPFPHPWRMAKKWIQISEKAGGRKERGRKLCWKAWRWKNSMKSDGMGFFWGETRGSSKYEIPEKKLRGEMGVGAGFGKEGGF